MSDLIEWMNARHDDNWAKRLRRVASGYIPTGLRLPGEKLRDAKGRYTRKAGE